MSLERRHSSRCTIRPAGYAWLGTDHKAIVLNVGDCGIGILGSSAIKSDSDVELRIMLDLNSSILSAKGKIVWANDTGEAGIHLQLPEWHEYAQQWRSLSRSVFAGPVVPPATSATLISAPEQLQTVGYADDGRVVTQLRALRSVEADLEAKLVRRARIKYFAAITLAGLFFWGTVWLLRGRSPLFGSALTATRLPAASPQSPPAAASLPVVDAQSRSAFLEVLPGISYESGTNLVNILVDLPEHFDLHAVALRNPDRIYFDVPTSAVRVKRKSVEMSNDFVRRIRVSPRDGEVTRIVLDLRCSCTYRFQRLSGPRHRVQIEVWPQSTPTALAPTRAPVPRIAPSMSRASLA